MKPLTEINEELYMMLLFFSILIIVPLLVLIGMFLFPIIENALTIWTDYIDSTSKNIKEKLKQNK